MACSNQGVVEIRNRWLKYKSLLEKSMSGLIEYSMRESVEVLKRHVQYDMKFEFQFIDLDPCPPRRKDICADFWNVMVFRPDMATEVADHLCTDLRLPEKAKLLQTAIDDAGWPPDFWSDCFQSEASLSDLLRTGDALAGLATTSCDDLVRREVLTKEGAEAVRARAPFSEAKGVELARQLHSACRWSELRKFCEESRNRFLLAVFAAAARGAWPGCRPSLPTLPALPPYFTSRGFFPALRRSVEEAVHSDEQRWIVLSGVGGAGKTTAAVHLAEEASKSHRVLWIRFGPRTMADIYRTAQAIVRDNFPATEPGHLSNPEDFLYATLTREATRDSILFLDDVLDPMHLGPFVRVKVAIVTSYRRIEYHRVRKTTPIDVPLSLTEEESVAIVEKILEIKTLLDLDGGEYLRDILKNFCFNALATSTVASFIKIDEKKWNKAFFMKLKTALDENAKQRFEAMFSRLETRGHHYLDTGHSHVNIYAALDFIIENLSESLKEAFYSLIIFPRGAVITKNVFKKINENEDIDENLENLFERCLVQRRGEDFEVHDLHRDILEWKLKNPPEKRKSFFRKLVRRYEKDGWNSEEDDFFFLHFIPACLEAERVDYAQQLLRNVDYLLSRFIRFRFINLLKDFDAVLQVEKDKATIIVRQFLLDPELWKERFDRKSLLRQALVLDRRPPINSQLLALAETEIKLPLYRAEDQRRKIETIHFEEVTCSDVGTEIKELALNESGSGLAVTNNKELLLLSPRLSICKRSSFSEEVLCVSPTELKGWLLVTSKGCVLINSHLCEESRWSAEGTVEKAAVEPGGTLAVLWIPDRPLLLFWTQTKKAEEIDGIPPMDWKVRALAASSRNVAAVCFQEAGEAEMESREHPSLLQKVFVWSVEERKVSVKFEKLRSTSESFGVQDCAFLENDSLVLGNQLFLRLLNLRTGSLKFSLGIIFSSVVPLRGSTLQNIRSCPDGHLTVVQYQRFISIRDSNLSQLLKIENSGFDPAVFSVSNSAFLLCLKKTEIYYFRRCNRITSFPLIKNRPGEIVEAKWLPEIEDFALFLLEDKQLVVKKAGSGSQMFCWLLKGWTLMIRLTFRGDTAAVWEVHGGHLILLSLRKWSVQKEFSLEETILDVAMNDTHVAVGTRSSIILGDIRWPLPTDGDRSRMKLFLFEKTIGVQYDKYFRIFSLSGSELPCKCSDKGVLTVGSLSPGGQSVMLYFDTTVLKVSQEGHILGQINHSGLCCGAHYLSDLASLTWDARGEAFVTAEGGEEKRRLEFPEEVKIVKLAEEDGSLVVLSTKNDQLWIANLQSGECELLIDLKSFDWLLEEVYISPRARRIFVKTFAGQSFILSQREDTSKSFSTTQDAASPT